MLGLSAASQPEQHSGGPRVEWAAIWVSLGQQAGLPVPARGESALTFITL
jgi:hypothetical protein